MKSKHSNVLDGSVCYLSGAMEKAADFGISWRQKFIKLTKDLNIRAIDPTNKPKTLGNQCIEDKNKVQRLKDAEKWDELSDFAKSFRRADLRFCDLCDFLVVYVDKDVPTWGTPDELYTVEDQKKPIFAIVEGGKKQTPAWLFAVLDHNYIFSSVEECVEHLRNINNGTIPLNNRWVLIRQYLSERNNENVTEEQFTPVIRDLSNEQREQGVRYSVGAKL